MKNKVFKLEVLWFFLYKRTSDKIKISIWVSKYKKYIYYWTKYIYLWLDFFKLEILWFSLYKRTSDKIKISIWVSKYKKYLLYWMVLFRTFIYKPLRLFYTNFFFLQDKKNFFYFFSLHENMRPIFFLQNKKNFDRQ